VDEGLLTQIRGSLRAKRETLRQWAEAADPRKMRDVLGPAGKEPFEQHLTVIENALEQAETDDLGICTVCDEPVESRLIQMDYTSCVCLTHLSEDERRSLESELELAAAVQRSLLPQTPPDIPHLEIAAFSRPAQIVGGDYFDFFRFAGGRHGVAISDVVGHGLSSSLIMASLQTMLRTLTQEHASPAELVARINRLCLHNIQFTTFITLFLGAFDPAGRELTYCNAGHNPPLVLRREGATPGEVTWLQPTGAAVGLAEDTSYTDQTIRLATGDLLLLYTDGATETMNPRGDLFEPDRLASAVREGRALPAQALLQAVRRRLEEFAEGAAPADDLTLVALRVVA
jgi:sigma-B regulation protein RsbU (phosphoserine phosphatase)